MGKIWSSFKIWFQGKKTILGGGVVMAAAVAGLWLGKIDVVTAVAVFGAGLTISGAGAKANRHQAEILTALQGVAAAGIDYRTGRPAQAVQEIESTIEAVASRPFAVNVGPMTISTSSGAASK